MGRDLALRRIGILVGKKSGFMSIRSIGFLWLSMGCLMTRPANANGRSGRPPRQEFNGPFSSWADVKKRFGAKANGRDDDTRALQTAIDSLSCIPTGYNTGKNGYTVLYLPAGTYCLSSTLVLRGKIGVSIIGEDPGRTIVKWIGGDKDTMLWANGSAYFKIARLGWDANGRKGMEGIGVHWKNKWNDGKTRSYASLNIELSDNYFTGGFQFGIGGGTFGPPDGTGNNDSEITIRRCIFRNCTIAGINIYGYNALDYWIWDCRFTGCYMGIACAFGNYHVCRSYFAGSKFCDMHNQNGYYISVRGCYSRNSSAFSLDAGSSSNPFKRIFQDNLVVDPHVLPIEYYHLGKITLMGNTFTRNLADTTRVSVNTKGWAAGFYEILSLNNTWGYKNPIRIASAPQRLYTSGDVYQSNIRPDEREFLKTMDSTAPLVRRKVWEVPAGAGADTIQSIIDQAAKSRGQRPVVHFGVGSYMIDKTLVIPAGADMQLKGDGLLYASMILNKGGIFPVRTAMIRVEGPSYIGIEDLQIGKDGEKGQPAGIWFKKVDQPGAQAHLDQIYSHADTSLFAGLLNYLYIQKENSFFTDGNYVSGGDVLQKGMGTARVCNFGGQFARLSVQTSGRFLAKDCWWEGDTRIPIDLEGSGTICIDGAKIAPNRADSTLTIRIGKFNGHISLMNMYVLGALSVRADNPALQLLAWNIHFYFKMDPLDFLAKGTNYAGAFLGMTTQCFTANDPLCKTVGYVYDSMVGVKDAESYLEKETAFDRNSKPVLYSNLSAGVSNIFISRVSIVGFRGRGLVFTAQ
jgi:Pectate lyase superfamily protein